MPTGSMHCCWAYWKLKLSKVTPTESMHRCWAYWKLNLIVESHAYWKHVPSLSLLKAQLIASLFSPLDFPSLEEVCWITSDIMSVSLSLSDWNICIKVRAGCKYSSFSCNHPTSTHCRCFHHFLTIPDKLWQSVRMDFIGLLPQSQGNDYLLVIIDQLMLQVHLVPTMMWVTAREVAWLFLKEIVRLHRVPESIVLDHNTKFTSTFWHELHKLMGTKLLMSTVFHPHKQMAQQSRQTAL